MKIRWKQKQKYIEDNIVIKITDQDLFFNIRNVILYFISLFLYYNYIIVKINLNNIIILFKNNFN